MKTTLLLAVAILSQDHNSVLSAFAPNLDYVRREYVVQPHDDDEAKSSVVATAVIALPDKVRLLQHRLCN
jgi:hypothetical protein